MLQTQLVSEDDEPKHEHRAVSREKNGEGVVASVSVNPRHGVGKMRQGSIRLLTGLGVEGDAHLGLRTQHRWLKRTDPTRPNLTQVHLLHAELFDELEGSGFPLQAGMMGENVTTRGIDLLGLPVGTRVLLGAEAVVEITGLREPCALLNRVQPGLMKAVLGRDVGGRVVRKAGVMGVVISGGEVSVGDRITVELPELPWVNIGAV